MLRPRGSVSIQVDADAHRDLVAGAGSAWASGDRTEVHRINMPGPHEVATIETGGGIPFDFEDGLVWGARPDELWAINPATNEVSRHIELSGLSEVLAVDVVGNEAWIAARHPGYVGTVLHVNLNDGVVLREEDVSLPAGVAVADDFVWVTSYETNELVGFPR